jgi:serine/threonine protein kinase/tetratricopeptide (TPR) repeat protein
MKNKRIPDVGRDYRLLKSIGTGSFGEVWQAEAPGGVLVAIKVIRGLLTDEEAQNELKSLDVIKNLHHAFLAQPQAFWVVDNRLVIAMELADGNLRHRLKECINQGQPGIPPAELLRYFFEAADALDYLHENHVVHRDIKPDNLLLRNKHVKVADFGLVRENSQMMMSMSVCGTPGYMAPEVWGGRGGPASDQYSLACAYAELRLGRMLFPHRNFESIKFAHRRERPDLTPIPAAEQEVLFRALSKDPEDRFATCTEMVEALEEALADLLPPRSPSGSRPRVSKLPASTQQGTLPEDPRRTHAAPPNAVLSIEAPAPAQERTLAPRGKTLADDLPRTLPPAMPLPTPSSAPEFPASNGTAPPEEVGSAPPVSAAADWHRDVPEPPSRRWVIGLCIILGLLPLVALVWYMFGDWSRHDVPSPGRPSFSGRALLVGVRQPGKDWPGFRFAETDVAHLGRVLQAAGYPAGEVRTLTSSRGRIDQNTAPTADQVRAGLAWLVRDNRASDTLLVALAGHIVKFEGEPEHYFCPEGADLAQTKTLIPLSELVHTLAPSPAGCKMVLIECRNELPANHRLATEHPLARPRPWQEPDLQQPPEGVAILFSCSGEKGTGYIHESDRAGVFYSFVTRGLQGEADQDGDGEVTAAELAGYVPGAVVDYTLKAYGGKETKQQEPSLVGKAVEARLAVPGPALGHYLRGLERMSMKDWDGAGAEFSRAITDAPGYVEAYLRRAETRYYRQPGARGKAADYDEMIADCNEVQRLDPTCPAAPDYRGDALARQARLAKDRARQTERMEAAVKAYKEALDRDPDYAATWNSRGLALLNLGNYARARMELARNILNAYVTILLQNQPIAAASCTSYFLKARVHYDEARKDLESALLLAPRKTAFLHENLGKAHFALEEYNQAHKELTKAINLEPDAIRYVLRGRILAAQGNHHDAINDFTDAIRLNPNYAAAYGYRAKSYEAQNQTAFADQDWAEYKRLSTPK